VVGVEPVGGAEEMPGRWHEVVCGVEQIAGFIEVVNIRCATIEGVADRLPFIVEQLAAPWPRKTTTSTRPVTP
jgi:hypothetical protein